MKRFSVGLSVFFTVLFSLFMCVNAQAQEDQVTTTTTTTQATGDGTVTKVVETRNVVTTPVPAAKEVIAAPQGYASCFDVDAGWFDNVWVPKHRVCQYENSTEGVVWIEGYWGCNKATSEGVCTNWDWKSGHWEKKLVVY